MSKLKTPEERKAINDAKLKAEEAKVKKLRSYFDTVAATEEGRGVFKYLMENLGFHKRMITMNPETGEINKETSAYLEARRSVYLDIREKISDKYLKKIEF